MGICGLMEAYQSAKPRLNGMTFRQFKEAAKGFDVNPIIYKGKPIGAILVRDELIHVCVLPQYAGRWLKRCHIDVLNAIIEKHGRAVTQATTESGIAIVERFGFVKQGDFYVKGEKWVSKQS